MANIATRMAPSLFRWLRQCGAAGSLAGDGVWRAPRAEVASFSAASQAGDFPVHAWGAVASRYVRLKASTRKGPREASSLRQAPRCFRPHGEPAEIPVEVSAIWTIRSLGQRVVSTCRQDGGPVVRVAIDGGRIASTRRPVAAAAYRSVDRGGAKHWFLDLVRFRARELELARLRIVVQRRDS